jgi:chemotaxis protein CheC
LRKLRVLSDHSMRRAGESLTMLLGHPVRLATSKVTSLPIGVFPTLAVPADAGPMAGLRIQITGEAAGQMVFLFPLRTIFRMLRSLLGVQEEPSSLSSEGQSAVQEVGNILASSFLTELSNLLGRRLMPTPPQFYLGDVSELMQQVTAELEKDGSEILMVQATFEDPEGRIKGRFFVLPEMASLAGLLEGLGVDDGPKA